MRIYRGMGELVQKLFPDFVVVRIDTSSFHAHRANQGVAMVVGERKSHFLAIDLDCDLVRGFHVATFGLSPLFVLMHKSILCYCTEIYKCTEHATTAESL